MDLPVAGDIGVFCHADEEYNLLVGYKERLTISSDNPNQKYFQLKAPLVFSGVTYEWLYIRKPDPTPYGNFLGDIDFIMGPTDFGELKQRVRKGEVPGAEIYERPGWDMVQLSNPEIDSVAFVCTREMAEKIKVKF